MPVLTNPKHELFAQALAKGSTADQAYQDAGYKANSGNAATLKGNQRIKDRVVELQGRAAERTIYTIEDIVQQLAEDREFARRNGHSAAAISATVHMARLLGLGTYAATPAAAGASQVDDDDPYVAGGNIVALREAIKRFSVSD